MLRDLLKRTQVRLAATFALLFTLATSALFALLVFKLTDEIEDRVRARVLRTKDALLAVDRKYGFDELAGVVTDEANPCATPTASSCWWVTTDKSTLATCVASSPSKVGGPYPVRRYPW